MAGRVSQFLAALRQGLVRDVPPEYQACESCREPSCDSVKAENCLDRRYGEQQERSRRFDRTGSSGTHAIGKEDTGSYDVAMSRLVGPPPPSSRVRSRGDGEYSQSGGEDVVNVPDRIRTNTR
jgi:hypothetical protein